MAQGLSWQLSIWSNSTAANRRTSVMLEGEPTPSMSQRHSRSSRAPRRFEPCSSTYWREMQDVMRVRKVFLTERKSMGLKKHALQEREKITSGEGGRETRRPELQKI